MLRNLAHRGGRGAEPNTGDGAGILVQIPHRFFARASRELGFALPAPGEYGVGALFLPSGQVAAEAAKDQLTGIVTGEGQQLLGWREVPVDTTALGASARAVAPRVAQVFIARGAAIQDQQHFERKLYVIRKRFEKAQTLAYVSSLSSRTLIYKGMLAADQVADAYPDLTDPGFESAMGLVHERFSTNTFPSWPLAHPYRYVAHNGEINTLRGNLNWMRAREALCRSELFGADLEKVLPVTRDGQSDTATFDNVLEFLVMAGRPLPHAVLMMIPEPWSGHASMTADRKAFYEYHSTLMEPWDGPASIAFTDGQVIGAVLDRNGLRPSRYYVTTEDLVVMGSEVGVLDIPPENVVLKDRLRPGRMFLVDTVQGRIISDEEIKSGLAAERPYHRWLADHRLVLEDLPPGLSPLPESLPRPRAKRGGGGEGVGGEVNRQQAFGYTQEDLRILLAPMATTGEEPLGSMGADSALAVLSDRPRLLFDYFKQLFAQVTNPPLDAIREELVTSLDSWIGPEGNLLEPGPMSCRRIRLKYPVLDSEDFARVAAVRLPGLKARTLPIGFEAAGSLAPALDLLARDAAQAVRDGCGILVLSDRTVSEHAIPSLLATAAVHHHLIREGLRARCGLVVESGDAREVHHVSLLIGYGANAVTPWLAIETIGAMIADGTLSGVDRATGVKRYVRALNKGVLKVMSKMGISTLQGYCGAQIFEAIGLSSEVVEQYFTGTASRIGGIGLGIIAAEVAQRCGHPRALRTAHLPPGGEYQWRKDGEYHLFNPDTVFKLQHATRSGQFSIYREYTRLVDEQNRRRATLRGLMELKTAPRAIPLEGVEPAEAIIRRFATGAMSYGSIGQEAHETLAIAMNRIGGKSNTGEGGEDPRRYVRDANGDSRRSAIKQVASARFGVTSEYLVEADDLQIKMAQGAKPGVGGQLPGHKVYPWIAAVRLSTPGVGLISPPPHHDIYCIEDLAQLIHDLKNANPRARVHVKLVAEVGVGTVAAGVAKAKADVVLISGHDGGTGASPLTSIRHGGVPWELGLAETQQVLLRNRLRDRIVVQVDGQMKTGRDVVIAALLGAEEFGFSTAPLVVMGCVMMRVCHLNTCPVGIATQDPELRKRFAGKPEFVENFFRFVAEEVRLYLAAIGVRTLDEAIGRTDLLNFAPALDHWKANGLDYTAILHQPDIAAGASRRSAVPQQHGLDKSLDVTTIIPACRQAIVAREPVELELPIRNVHRTVGTQLGYRITSRWGADGLPDDTIRLRFTGSAGQSFGAFLPRGVTMLLKGDANDYFGKGLSGGWLAAFPPREVNFTPEENVIIGNVALYGATAGEAYVRGLAGERFAVRNSGATAVVEGVGDHACEYMTGGRVVVLGPTGRNFGAGMSGGIAYVLDLDQEFAGRCNTGMVELESLEDPQEILFLRHLVRRHVSATRSTYARRILARWTKMQPRFVKVMPTDYKRVLEDRGWGLGAGGWGCNPQAPTPSPQSLVISLESHG